MKFYLYCSQDLIVEHSKFENICAKDFYMIEFEKTENIKIYSPQNAGVIILNKQILTSQNHNQITFHKMSDNSILCEINPFVCKENVRKYELKNTEIEIVQNLNIKFIYFNTIYYGFLVDSISNIEFKKIENSDVEYGIIYFDSKKMLIFDNNDIIYCGQYVDNEILKNEIKIYYHIPNIFNVGQLLACNLTKGGIENKTIKDRGEEYDIANKEFAPIYFLESLKCRRYKNAYKRLSYELKSEIDEKVLKLYFNNFDEFRYILEQDVYITFNCNKIVGVYHIESKDGLIYKIY